MKKSAKRRKSNISLEKRVVELGLKIKKAQADKKPQGYIEILKVKAEKLVKIIEDNKKISMRAIQEAFANREFEPAKPTLQTPPKSADNRSYLELLPPEWGTGKRKTKKRLYRINKAQTPNASTVKHRELKEKGKFAPKVNTRKLRVKALLDYFGCFRGPKGDHKKLVISLKKHWDSTYARPMDSKKMTKILKKRESCKGNTKTDRIARRANWSEKRKSRTLHP